MMAKDEIKSIKEAIIWYGGKRSTRKKLVVLLEKEIYTEIVEKVLEKIKQLENKKNTFYLLKKEIKELSLGCLKEAKI